MDAQLGKENFKNNITFHYIDEITSKNQKNERRKILNGLCKNNEKFKKISLNLKLYFQDLNFILLLSFFISLFSNVFTFEKIRFEKLNYFRRINYNSVINMTIYGNGTQYILSETASFNGIPFPNKLKINNEDEITGINDIKHNLPSDKNRIIMIWDEPLTSVAFMFMQMTNLIDIDLSSFDFSLVTDMSFFFVDALL